MATCAVATAVVVACIVFDLWWIFTRARIHGREILLARNWLRLGWPMHLALVAAVLAVIFAGEYAC